jgi:cell division protein FtsB
METITIILAVLTPLCTIGAFIFARADATRKQGKEDGQLKKDIEYVKANTEKISVSVDKLNDLTVKAVTDVAVMQNDIETLYRRVEKLENSKTVGKNTKEN